MFLFLTLFILSIVCLDDVCYVISYRLQCKITLRVEPIKIPNVSNDMQISMLTNSRNEEKNTM